MAARRCRARACATCGTAADRACSSLSPQAAYKARLIELGYEDIANDEDQLQKVVEGAKTVADQKKVCVHSVSLGVKTDLIYAANSLVFRMT